MTETVESDETESDAPENQTPPTDVVEEPPGLLYHYTSAAGLVGIVDLDHKKPPDVARRLTFFASDLLWMNDATELAFAGDAIRKYAQQIGRELEPLWLDVCEKYLSEPSLESLRIAPRPSVCAVSFTEEADLLSQWVTYGAGGGFAIGLDAKALHAANYPGFRVGGSEPRDFECLLSRVRYGSEVLVRIADLPLFDPELSNVLKIGIAVASVIFSGRSVWDALKEAQEQPPQLTSREHVAAAMLVAAAAQCKHQAFDKEKEWRLLAGGGSDLPHLLSGTYRPQFRSVGSRVLPYRTITIDPVGDQSLIEELVVGPSPNQAQLMHAAQQLLRANGHDHTVVRPSTVPYRGW
nr:hypothetical protein [Mycobacterium sp. UM_NZ2]